MDSKADRAYGNDLSRRTLEFAIPLIDLVNALPKSRAADVIGKQLLRSSTSIGANYPQAALFYHSTGYNTTVYGIY